ncbi:MAG TPA: 1,2-phenylacetyl-CoA epoxidase subunit PaaD [Actinocrinis sp.]
MTVDVVTGDVVTDGPVNRARRLAEQVADPELPMLTLADLGVLRDVAVTADGAVVASLTPTYSGCPAIAEMRAAVAARLREAGFERVEIRTVLNPPWTTDWITPAGRRKLAEHGIAPPAAARDRHSEPGPVLIQLSASHRSVPCPRCGSADTEETSRFAATACRSLWRCRSCREPFEHVKEI